MDGFVGKSAAGISTLVMTLGIAAGAHATEWAHDRTRIIVSHGVGSSQNQTTRVLGDVWQEYLGTDFTYENRGGSSGRIGYDLFQRQNKDGSVLLSSNVGSASIMYAQQKPDWNWRETLVPIGMFAVDPGVIFVNADSEFQTFSDIVEASQDEPLTMAISFWASPENLQIQQVMAATGAQFDVVPIGSSDEVITQMLGGHYDVGYQKVATVERAGDNLRAIAVPLAQNPIPGMTNNAPTVDEVIGAETMGIASYRVILAHKEWADANPEQVDLLQSTLAEALQDERLLDQMERIGVPSDLVYTLSTEEIYTQILDRYWDAFDQFGDIYSEN
jgi:tripartite-type tricarboxylate transporter receptor subunit TctC